MIIARNLSLSFGVQSILKDATFTINKEQRVGLVGRNGSGKSTLLSLIAGLNQPDGGALSVSNQYTLAYLPQEVTLASKKSIIDETMTAFADVSAINAELKQLEVMLENKNFTQSVFDRYHELQEKLQELNPDRARAEVERMLIGLGFSAQQFDQPVSTLSVGWKMRIVLAKLLLQKADFYLFDEPTNHLDIVAKEWFLDFLKNAPFGFLLVSHERYFLDELCTTILELELGNATFYTGNYAKYEQLKERNTIALHQAYEQQQKEIKQKQATIDRFRASANKARMAQSMIKQLDKIERIELPPTPKTVNFAFPPVTRPGKIVLKVHNVGHTFETKKIFDNASFMLERGQKAAIIAPNGGGKTTLFNCIAGKLPLQQGHVSFGHNVDYALFDQDQNVTLALDKTVYENIADSCPTISSQTIRSFLGSFLFSNDDIQKKVKVLSGGEKNRVGMVKTLLQNANLLLLDEPTNHLDIPSKQILLKALQNYEGTILFVSHDRDFISELATQIIELTPKQTVVYPGNYDDYVYAKQQQSASAGTHTKAPVAKKNEQDDKKNCTKQRHELNKKCNALERKIEKLEKDIQKASERLATMTYGQDGYQEAVAVLENLQNELNGSMQEWESTLENLA